MSSAGDTGRGLPVSDDGAAGGAQGEGEEGEQCRSASVKLSCNSHLHTSLLVLIFHILVEIRNRSGASYTQSLMTAAH